MALETGNYIKDLDSANPANSDGKAEGDDHLRLIKKVLKNSFPGMAGPFGGVISLSSPRTLVSDDRFQVILATNAMTLPLAAVASLGAGWTIEVWATNGSVVIDPDGSEQINGANTFLLPQGSNTKIISDGTRFYATQTVPRGVITMWGGLLADVPAGWLVCDGTNGTPDLRDKFIVGAGNDYAVTATGGSADAVVVEHTHSGTTANNGLHTHFGLRSQWPSAGSANSWMGRHDNTAAFQVDVNAEPNTARTSSGGAHNHPFTTNPAGSSGVDANLPPYYALYYIQKA